MPSDKISYVNTSGGTSDAFGDIDAAASLEQVPGVYQPSAQNDKFAYKDIDAGHGGVNQPVKAIQPASDSITVHDSVGEQPEIAGSLTRPAAQYSHDKKK